MAIQTTNITLDGLVHTLDDRDRVAAQLVNENANTYTGVNTFSGGLTHTVGQIRRSPGYLVADAANDTTITTCVSGHTYFFGTATGLPGASDGDNAFTFALPTPTQAGEEIHIYPQNAAVYAKLLGFTVVEESTDTIYYQVYEPTANNTALIETATTVTGTHGTNNTMVKIATSHFIVGDEYHAISLSSTVWLLRIIGRNNLIAAGDIVVDPGNASGYID